MTADNANPNADYQPERVVVSVAHADDIEFGAAGTVARWVEGGASVTYIIITDNRSGSNDPDADLDALIKTREQEQIASAEAVGVTDVRFLGYQDGNLQPTLELRKQLTAIIREVRPDAVITLDPETIITAGRDYINHPDHRAAGEATLYAVFPSAETRPIFPELLDAGLEPTKVNKMFLTLTNHPDTIIDISATMGKKRQALLQHKSQLNGDVIEMIEKWNSETGKEAGFEYAERFRVLNLNSHEEEAES